MREIRYLDRRVKIDEHTVQIIRVLQSKLKHYDCITGELIDTEWEDVPIEKEG